MSKRKRVRVFQGERERERKGERRWVMDDDRWEMAARGR